MRAVRRQRVREPACEVVLLYWIATTDLLALHLAKEQTGWATIRGLDDELEGDPLGIDCEQQMLLRPRGWFEFRPRCESQIVIPVPVFATRSRFFVSNTSDSG